MPEIKSVSQMLDFLQEHLDDENYGEWEESFIRSVSNQVARAGDTTVGLSTKQVDKIEQLYKKYA